MEAIVCWVYCPATWANTSFVFISICQKAPRKKLKSSEHQTERLFFFISRKFCISKACVVNCCSLTKEVVLSVKSESAFSSRPSSSFWAPVFYRNCTTSFFSKIHFPWRMFSRPHYLELELQVSDTQIHCALRLRVEFSEICGCSCICGIRSLSTKVVSTPHTTIF